MKGTKYIVHLAVAMLLVAVMLPLGLVVMSAEPVFAAATTDVSGNITAKIEFEAPDAISSWALAQGANTQDKSGTAGLTVWCNTNWTATVSDADSTNTSGYMTSYNGTTYSTGTKLDNAMHVICSAEGTDVTLPNAANIATGVVGGQGDGDVGESFTIRFSQQIEYKDAVLTTPNYYRIVVTFSATI